MATVQVARILSESTSPINFPSRNHNNLSINSNNNKYSITIMTSPHNLEGITPLMVACQQGRTTDVRIILRKKVDAVRDRTRSEKVPLHFCAEGGSVDCLEVILEADITLINAQDEEGYTPLHLAVINGNKDIVKAFIAARADLTCLDNEKHSIVHWATVCGELDILDILLIRGAPATTADIHLAHPIHYAAQMCGNVNGHHSNSNSRVQSTLYGVSPKKGLLILRRLIQHGVPIDVRDQDGRQPLLWAASAGSADAILSLMNAGACVEAEDKDGLTALHCAASRGHTDCLETLIALCGAEVDVIDKNGCTGLFYSITLGHADCTELLLNFGAEPNRQDRKGRTPAHCGASKGQLETIKLYAKHGGNLWLRNVRGDLPLHEAVISRRKDLVTWLLSQRPDTVNAPNSDGRCPIHLAALHNNVEMVKILIDHHADVNPLMRTGKGIPMTPLDAAIHRGNSAVAKFLQLHGGLPANSLNDAATQRRLNRSLDSQARSTSSLHGSQLGRNHEQSPDNENRVNFISPEILETSIVHQYSHSVAGTLVTETSRMVTSTPIMHVSSMQTDSRHYLRDMEVQVSEDFPHEDDETYEEIKSTVTELVTITEGAKNLSAQSKKPEKRHRRKRSSRDKSREAAADSTDSDTVKQELTVSRSSRLSRSRKNSDGSPTLKPNNKIESNDLKISKTIKSGDTEMENIKRETSYSVSQIKVDRTSSQESSDNFHNESEKFSELENVAAPSSESEVREEELHVILENPTESAAKSAKLYKSEKNRSRPESKRRVTSSSAETKYSTKSLSPDKKLRESSGKSINKDESCRRTSPIKSKSSTPSENRSRNQHSKPSSGTRVAATSSGGPETRSASVSPETTHNQTKPSAGKVSRDQSATLKSRSSSKNDKLDLTSDGKSRTPSGTRPGTNKSRSSTEKQESRKQSLSKTPAEDENRDITSAGQSSNSDTRHRLPKSSDSKSRNLSGKSGKQTNQTDQILENTSKIHSEKNILLQTKEYETKTSSSNTESEHTVEEKSGSSPSSIADQISEVKDETHSDMNRPTQTKQNESKTSSSTDTEHTLEERSGRPSSTRTDQIQELNVQTLCGKDRHTQTNESECKTSASGTDTEQTVEEKSGRLSSGRTDQISELKVKTHSGKDRHTQIKESGCKNSTSSTDTEHTLEEKSGRPSSNRADQIAEVKSDIQSGENRLTQTKESESNTSSSIDTEHTLEEGSETFPSSRADISEVNSKTHSGKHAQTKKNISKTASSSTDTEHTLDKGSGAYPTGETDQISEVSKIYSAKNTPTQTKESESQTCSSSFETEQTPEEGSGMLSSIRNDQNSEVHLKIHSGKNTPIQTKEGESTAFSPNFETEHSPENESGRSSSSSEKKQSPEVKSRTTEIRTTDDVSKEKSRTPSARASSRKQIPRSSSGRQSGSVVQSRNPSANVQASQSVEQKCFTENSFTDNVASALNSEKHQSSNQKAKPSEHSVAHLGSDVDEPSIIDEIEYLEVKNENNQLEKERSSSKMSRRSSRNSRAEQMKTPDIIENLKNSDTESLKNKDEKPFVSSTEFSESTLNSNEISVEVEFQDQNTDSSSENTVTKNQIISNDTGETVNGVQKEIDSVPISDLRPDSKDDEALKQSPNNDYENKSNDADDIIYENLVSQISLQEAAARRKKRKSLNKSPTSKRSVKRKPPPPTNPNYLRTTKSQRPAVKEVVPAKNSEKAKKILKIEPTPLPKEVVLKKEKPLTNPIKKQVNSDRKSQKTSSKDKLEEDEIRLQEELMAALKKKRDSEIKKSTKSKIPTSQNFYKNNKLPNIEFVHNTVLMPDMISADGHFQVMNERKRNPSEGNRSTLSDDLGKSNRDSGYSDQVIPTTSASEDQTNLKNMSKSTGSIRRRVLSKRPKSNTSLTLKKSGSLSSANKVSKTSRDRKRFETTLAQRQGVLSQGGSEETTSHGGSVSSEEGSHSRLSKRRNGRPRSKLTFSKGEDIRNSSARLSPQPKKPVDIATPISVTQAMQASMRKYHLERKIFQELLELKRLQIRAGKANEQILVKRLSDSYKKAGLSINFRDYDGPFTFRNFEKYLYDQLRLLQANRRILPRFAPSDDLEKLSTALKKMNATKLPFLEDEERCEDHGDHSQCTLSTHRCHHAAHAYTGVPCAAYIGKGRRSGFLPRVDPLRAPGPTQNDPITRNIMNGQPGVKMIVSPRVDQDSPITLEVQQGSKTQIFALPSQSLDPTKNYYVSLSIRPTPSPPVPPESPSKPTPNNLENDHVSSGVELNSGQLSAPPPPLERDSDIANNGINNKHNQSF